MAAGAFKDFTREWGGLLVQDPSACLDRLMATYVKASDAEDCTATMEDYTDLWTAAKRSNMEWAATCMVRSVRQSTAMGGTVTLFQLMTSMTCWAAALHQRTPDFFKTCDRQVRDVASHVATRCSAWISDDDPVELYREITFSVALELFGWHDALLTCLRAIMTQHKEPTDMQDVRLFMATVSQCLTPQSPPRGFSTESTPNLTTGRTSALSSSSEHDGMPLNHHDHAKSRPAKEEGAVLTDYLPSPPQRCPRSEGAASLHAALECSRAVGTARGEGGGVKDKRREGKEDNIKGSTRGAWPTTAATAQRSGLPSSPTVSIAPHYGPSTHAPPASTTGGRANDRSVPQQAPRSRGTPQPSPKNSLSDVATPVLPPPPPPHWRDSATTTTTTASCERARKDEIREKRWPVAPRRGRGAAAARKDNHGCTAF
jgi:hypothetical protein